MSGPAARELADLARAILDGGCGVPARQRTRAAALLARRALEEVVRTRLTELGAALPRATVRSRLIVLHVLAPPEVSGPARAAWEGLTRACHRHAYELAPADAEIRALLDHVDQLVDAGGARPWRPGPSGWWSISSGSAPA